MPKRTSALQKRLSGSPNAKKPVSAAPIDAKPASGLDATAQKEWTRILVGFEQSGRLTELDQSILAVYCAAFSRWKRAEHSLLTDGDVLWVEVRDTHGKVTHTKPIVNPMGKVCTEAARAVHRFGDALGLSPAARTKQGYEFAADKGGRNYFEMMEDDETEIED